MENRINLIKDGNQYHLTIGEADAWMSAEDINELTQAIINAYTFCWSDPSCLRGLICTLKRVSNRFSGKTIENIIQQLEAIVKEVEK